LGHPLQAHQWNTIKHPSPHHAQEADPTCVQHPTAKMGTLFIDEPGHQEAQGNEDVQASNQEEGHQDGQDGCHQDGRHQEGATQKGCR